MKELRIKRCAIETIQNTIYFDIEYLGVSYNYLSLEISEEGYVWLMVPKFCVSFLEVHIECYSFNFCIENIIRDALWEYVKNVPIALEMLRSKSTYKGEEFKF